ncbi:hypothetical protein SODALDRAFT_329336 [Sodiomyces alkalinus F11]|uniref:Protamine P1 n=1 Tax=Sodiomyces alkalinus (strain CBS 110278 / VKM F-3762 / F11) TaxID=1314773 RepID=A0A3N2PL81_SODAK|nr:hypothetical protein SODALDRAFT_329336 [Sodiomyces alkalinus F11]ROT35164.1 hypothetical protein SODALDRAFT_329336 [Sodiomyces alkalinus F11]
MATAPCESLLQAGDEPLYCEADPSEVLWEGSDDEQYPSPAHRKWAYEKSAVRFLEGAPIRLLSSTLQGPFDQASGWVNPWRSKKGSLRSQSRTTTTTGPRRRLHRVRVSQRLAIIPSSASPCIDDSFAENHPKTRPGSVCHLPSPESLDRPADIPHQYLDEDELAKVETWRSTVEPEKPKKEILSPNTPRKRPAGTSSWLKRPHGKRLRTSESLDEEDMASMLVQNANSSPSTRKLVSSQLWDDVSGEDELNFGVQTSLRSPESSQSSDRKIPTRCGPLGAPQGLVRGVDLSDDELSWPSGSTEKKSRTWPAASVRSQVSHRQPLSGPKSSPSRRFLRYATNAHSSPTSKMSKKRAEARMQEEEEEEENALEFETQQDNSFVFRARRKTNKTVSPRREVASSLPEPSLSPRVVVKEENLDDSRVDNATDDADNETFDDDVTDFTSLGTREEEELELPSRDICSLENVSSDLLTDASSTTASNPSPEPEQAQMAENTFAATQPSTQPASPDPAKPQPQASVSGGAAPSNAPAIDAMGEASEEESLSPSQLDSQPTKAIDVVPSSQPTFDSGTLVECMDAEVASQGDEIETDNLPLAFDEEEESAPDNERPGCLAGSPLREDIPEPKQDLTPAQLPETSLPVEMEIDEDVSNHECDADRGVEEVEEVADVEEVKEVEQVQVVEETEEEMPDVIVMDEVEMQVEIPTSSLPPTAPATEERAQGVVATDKAELLTSLLPNIIPETEEKAPDAIAMAEAEISSSSLAITAPVIEEIMPDIIVASTVETPISESSYMAPITQERTPDIVTTNETESPTPSLPDMSPVTEEKTPDVVVTNEAERPTFDLPDTAQKPNPCEYEQVGQVRRETTPLEKAASEVTPLESHVGEIESAEDVSLIVPASQQSPWKATQVVFPHVTSHAHTSHDGLSNQLPPAETAALRDGSMVAPSQETAWDESQNPVVVASVKRLSDVLRIDALIHHDPMDVDKRHKTQPRQAARQASTAYISPYSSSSQNSLVPPSQQTPWQPEASQLDLRQQIDFSSSQNSAAEGATQQESQSPWSRSFDSMRLVAHHALRLAGIGFKSSFASPSQRKTAENSQGQAAPAAPTNESISKRIMGPTPKAAYVSPYPLLDTQHTPTPAPAKVPTAPAPTNITLRAFRDFRSPSPEPAHHPTGEPRTSLGPCGKKRGILTDSSTSPGCPERPAKRVSWGPLPCESETGEDDGDSRALPATTPAMPSPSRGGGRAASPPPDQALADLPANREDAFHGHFNAVRLHAKGHRHRILPSSSSSSSSSPSRGPESPAPTAMADAFLAADEMAKGIHVNQGAGSEGAAVSANAEKANVEKDVGESTEEEMDDVDAVLQDLDEYIELISVEADVARARSERTTRSAPRMEGLFPLA